MSSRTVNNGQSGKARGPVGIGILLVLCLSAAAIGCSTLPQQGPQPMPQQGDGTAPTSTHTPSPTWPPTWTPTFTSTPIPHPTRTPTATSTPPPTPPGSAPAPRSTRTGTSGPLTIDFQINGKWCPSGPGYSAEFTVWAEGGGGAYTYYRDIDLIEGPTDEAVTYQLEWADCGGAPGTFYVKSGDGQQVSKKFWVSPPSCCN